MDEQTCLIDGFGPLPLVRPESAAALGDVVRQAARDKTALYPVGGQTMLNLGMAPAAKGHAVDVRGLSQIIDFPARDMTVTVQAGITLHKLGQIVGGENLRLPIDVPRGEQATLGGALAANVSGSRRYGFGTLRDYVIGIGAVNDQGQEFKAGGRVVKNVAGYDLCKLLIGSLGTLGIITQVTLKLRPLAEEQALITLGCTDEVLDTVLDKVHASRTRPVCVELLNGVAARQVLGQANLRVPSGDWLVIVGFEGNAEAVNWQMQQLVREIGAQGDLEAVLNFTAGPLWQALGEWDLWSGAQLTYRAGMLPSAVSAFCRAVGGRSEQVSLRSHAGNGIVSGHFLQELSSEAAARALHAWRELNSAGYVIAPRCPPPMKRTLSVWGPPSPDAWLMRDVKMKLDPGRLFNPGRFLDGI